MTLQNGASTAACGSPGLGSVSCVAKWSARTLRMPLSVLRVKGAVSENGGQGVVDAMSALGNMLDAR